MKKKPTQSVTDVYKQQTKVENTFLWFWFVNNLLEQTFELNPGSHMQNHLLRWCCSVYEDTPAMMIHFRLSDLSNLLWHE